MREKTNKEEKRNVLVGVAMPWNESDQHAAVQGNIFENWTSKGKDIEGTRRKGKVTSPRRRGLLFTAVESREQPWKWNWVSRRVWARRRWSPRQSRCSQASGRNTLASDRSQLE